LIWFLFSSSLPRICRRRLHNHKIGAAAAVERQHEPAVAKGAPQTITGSSAGYVVLIGAAWTVQLHDDAFFRPVGNTTDGSPWRAARKLCFGQYR
jgi:hypothetical protein